MKKPLLFGIILTACVVIVAFVFAQFYPEGMISYWKFEEGSGPTASDSVGVNDGTLINGPVWTSGKVGGALSFDGLNDYVDCGNDASLDINDEITLEAWVYPTGLTSTSEGIVGFKETPSQDGYEIGLNHGGSGAYICFYLKTPTFVKSTTLISLNTWTHVVGTYDGSNLKIYLNGSLDCSFEYYGGIYPNLAGSSLTIGRWYGDWDDYYFKGLIDEVAIYNRALSVEEIEQHYQDGLHGLGYDVECFPPPAGMVGWWPGDGNAEDFINENDGGLQGNTTFTTGRVGQAFSFDGDDDYVIVPNDPIFDLTSQGSWTAWVKLDHHVENLVQHIVTVNQGNVPGRQWALEINQANKLQMAIRKSDNSNWIKCADSQDFSLNQWVFVAATYNNASSPSLNIYRDGNPVASNDTYHGNINTGTLSELRISSDVWEFNGLIDEVEIYNRALSADEIQGIYNAGSAGKCKVAPVIEVDIDIKPGSYPNSINLGEHGLLPVVILGSSTLDVTTIVPSTIAIGKVNLASRGSKKAPKLAYSYETVNDGYTNMMVFFDVQMLVNEGVLGATTDALILTATLDDGTLIAGTDSVRVLH